MTWDLGVAAVGGEPDPTKGATHYYAKTIPAPFWAALPAIPCGTFGNQIFWKGVK